MGGAYWHVCPECKERFRSSNSRRKYCSDVCKRKALNIVKFNCYKPRDEKIVLFREALEREWFNPEPWKGQATDSMVYGNMVFL